MLKQIGVAHVRSDITTLKLCKEMESYRFYPVLEQSDPVKHNGVYTLIVNMQGDKMQITHEEFALYFDLWKSLASESETVDSVTKPKAKRATKPKATKAKAKRNKR